jgi:ferredoxin
MSEETASHWVRFHSPRYPAVRLARGSMLSEHLDVANSPLLFGCRTGICGTCLIKIEAVKNGALAPPSPEEQELLDLIAPDEPRARLACQIELLADITLRRLD